MNNIQNTTVDLVVAGHTHRPANTVIGRIPVVEGFNAGASYSVAQLMIKGGDVAWAGTAVRIAKNLGVARRPDVQAIVDAANTETAPLRNRVIGSAAAETADIRRDPARLSESEVGNLVTDAMLAKYPEAVLALTNSGGLRADLPFAPTGPEAPGQITWGEVFAVLPFNNRAALVTVTGAQLRDALLNGLSPACNPNIATGRFPQVANLRIQYRCNGTTPEITALELGPAGGPGHADHAGAEPPHRHQRLHGDGRRRLHGPDRRHRQAAARRAAHGGGRLHHGEVADHAGRGGRRGSHRPCSVAPRGGRETILTAPHRGSRAVPPFAETRGYVARGLRLMARLR